tara:strand:- start:537 stop:710 length:174 start_codon:yes stop_codon:yes gene_type:complete
MEYHHKKLERRIGAAVKKKMVATKAVETPNLEGGLSAAEKLLNRHCTVKRKELMDQN